MKYVKCPKCGYKKCMSYLATIKCPKCKYTEDFLENLKL